MTTDQSDEHLTKEELLTATRRIVEDREMMETAPDVFRRPPKKTVPPKFDWSEQGALVFGSVLGAIVVLYVILGVCRTSDKPEKEPISKASMLPAVVEYGGQKMEGKVFVGMETTRTLKDEQLIAEIKQVKDAQGLPSEVFADNVPPEMNVAHELSKLFGIYKANPGELDKLRTGITGGEWKIADETLKQVSDILTRVESKRQDIRSMLKRENVCFSFEFTESEEGLIPDTDGADFLEDYVLLEEYAIARALLNGKVDDAVECLNYIFRIAQLTAEVRSPEVRSKAARIRRYALNIAQTVVLDPKFRKKNLIDLYEILKEQLETWTDDAEAWIGDRAGGLKVFNLVALYGPEGALEPNEIEELDQRGILEGYTKRRDLAQIIAKDQVYYLRAMRSLIDECRRPFFQRRTLLNRLFSEQRRLKGTPEEPIIAGFLLRGITELMEYIAFDRADCEAAFLAMSTSLKQPVPPEQFELDPLYGKKYETRRMLNPTEPKISIVQTAYSNSLKPFRVPDYSNEK